MNTVGIALELETAFRNLSKTKIVDKDQFTVNFEDELLRGLNFWLCSGYLTEYNLN